MDKISKKILIELDKNPKITTAQLAKKVRISQQVAHYRLQHLENKIFGTIINLKKLGYEQYVLFFQLKEPNDKIPLNTYWSARVGGSFDIVVFLSVRNFQEHNDFIKELDKKFPIKDYLSCYVLNYQIFKHKYLSKDTTVFQYGHLDKEEKIDSLDKQILQKIKNNCRISSVEVAKKLKTTYKTVLVRFKKE